MSIHRILLSLLLAVLAAPALLSQTPIEITDLKRTGEVDFGKEILPLLRKNCLACHSATEAKGELVLESPATMVKGGDTGPALVPGKSGESLLLTLASHQDDPSMPPENNEVAAKPMTPEELGLIKLWIDQGATGSAADGVNSPTRWRQLPPGPNPVYAVAVSPDGQFAACGRANQIFIYHVATGQLVTRLTDPKLQQEAGDEVPEIAHLDIVQSLRFSHQGDRLASGGFRTVKIWRYPRDVQKARFDSADGVTAVAVSPARQLAVIGSADHSIQVWDLASGEVTRTLAGHAGAITSLRISDDDRRLYSASTDHSIRIWNLDGGQLLGTILTPGPVSSLALVTEPAVEGQDEGNPVDEPGQFLVSGGGDNFIRSWRLVEEFNGVPGGLPEKPVVITVDPLSGLVAVGTESGHVQLRVGLDGEIVRSWQAHEGKIEHLLLVRAIPEQGAPADERKLVLVTTGKENTLRVWDASTGKLRMEIDGTLSAITRLGANANGTRLLSANVSGQITVWKMDDQPVVEPLPHALQEIGRVVVSPDQSRLAVIVRQSERAAVAVVEARTGMLLQTLLGHDGPIHDLAFSPDNSRIVTGSADGTVRIWQLSDAKFPETLRLMGHTGAVHSVAFRADGNQLVSGGADKSVRTWDLATGEELKSFAGHGAAVVGVCFAANNQPVSVSADKTLKQWNPANGQVVRSVPISAVPVSMAVTIDRSLVSVALDDNSIAIHQLSDGKFLQALVGHTGPVRTHAFHNDKTQLVSVAADSRSHVWRVADGRLMQILPAEDLSAAVFGTVAGQVLLVTTDRIITETLRFQSAAPDYNQPVVGLTVHPNGTQFQVAYADGVLRGFTVETGQQGFDVKHGAAVRAMALRPDGQMLATAGEDKVVRFWNAANGAALAPTQLEGFEGPVAAVQFSADSRSVIALDGSPNPRWVVASATDGVVEEVIREIPMELHSPIVIGDQGSLSVAGVVGPTIRYWNVLNHRRIAGHTMPVSSLEQLAEMAFVSGSLDGTVRHWNLGADNPVVRSMNHGAPVVTLAVRSDGQRIASGSENNTVRLWNVTNGAQVAEMKGDLRAKGRVAKLTDQKNSTTTRLEASRAALKAAQDALPAIKTTETAAAKTLSDTNTDSQLKADELAKTTATKSAAEKLAIEAAAAAQKAGVAMEMTDQLALVAAAEAKVSSTLAARLKTAAAADPDNKDLATRATMAEQASAAATTKATQTEVARAAPTKLATDSAKAAEDTATKALATNKPFDDAAAALVASQGAQRTAKSSHDVAARDLAVAEQVVPDADKLVKELEAALVTFTEQLDVATNQSTAAEMPIRSLAFSPDGKQLASGGDFNVVHTWDGEDGKSIASYVGHEGPVQALAFLDDGELISGSVDKAALRWNLKPNWELERVIGSPTEAGLISDRVVTVDFSRDGTLLATGGGVPSRNGEVHVWKVADGSPILTLPDAHADGVTGVEISPDGTLVASASADKFVRVFDIATGQKRVQCEGHTNHVLGVSWRSNSRQLASSGADNTIRIWNADTGEQIRSIGGYNKQVSAVRFVGQTSTTVACSGDSIVRMNNSDNGGTVRNFGGSGDYMYAVDSSPNGQVVVAAGYDGVLRIWNGTNAQSLQVIEAPAPAEDEAEADAGEASK
jgi:WD40 repeat protein